MPKPPSTPRPAAAPPVGPPTGIVQAPSTPTRSRGGGTLQPDGTRAPKGKGAGPPAGSPSVFEREVPRKGGKGNEPPVQQSPKGKGKGKGKAPEAPAAAEVALPQGWVKLAEMSTGRAYYIHRKTKQTSWTRPT